MVDDEAQPAGQPGTSASAHSGFGSFGHLAVRFFGALDPRPPDPEQQSWARGWLLPGEQRLWDRMSGPDRRHAAGVARDVAALLADPSAPAGGADEPAREVMACALLHDVGKVESGFGTFSRVLITLAAIGAGRDRLAATEAPWTAGAGRRGLRERVADYLTHDHIGAQLLAAAGSHPTTIAWAAEHHLPPARWTLDRRTADALKEADGD